MPCRCIPYQVLLGGRQTWCRPLFSAGGKNQAVSWYSFLPFCKSFARTWAGLKGCSWFLVVGTLCSLRATNQSCLLTWQPIMDHFITSCPSLVTERTGVCVWQTPDQWREAPASHQRMPSHFSRVRLFATLWTVFARLLCPWDFPGKNTGVRYHVPLQGIFPTQRSNPHLSCFLHWQVSSLPLAPPGKPLVIRSTNKMSSNWVQSSPAILTHP